MGSSRGFESMHHSSFEIDLSSMLGSGSYAKVYAGRSVSTGKRVAAKVISTSSMTTSAIEKERSLMARIDHCHIIRLLGSEDRGRDTVLYMELADAGTLFGRVTSNGCLSEAEARPYMSQLMSAVGYLHGEGIVHCDIKLENILLDAKDQIKLSDFGLAHAFVRQSEGRKPAETHLTKIQGSKSYCAPEVLRGTGYHGYAADIWSCGVCCFAMHAGFFPLEEASDSDWRFIRLEQVDSDRSSTAVIFGFYERECTLSQDVIDLIDGMMALEPCRRPTAERLMSSRCLGGLAGGPADRAKPGCSTACRLPTESFAPVPTGGVHEPEAGANGVTSELPSAAVLGTRAASTPASASRRRLHGANTADGTAVPRRRSSPSPLPMASTLRSPMNRSPVDLTTLLGDHDGLKRTPQASPFAAASTCQRTTASHMASKSPSSKAITSAADRPFHRPRTAAASAPFLPPVHPHHRTTWQQHASEQQARWSTLRSPIASLAARRTTTPQRGHQPSARALITYYQPHCMPNGLVSPLARNLDCMQH
uniref:Protein kinase domain-containing protein n=1 Tax=Haptolina brevifila TaxID=156173 RepID=A0A7S2N421_9EUKA